MTTLSDRTIRGAIGTGALNITPFNERQLQGSSYDLTTDNKFLVPAYRAHPSVLDIKKPQPMNSIELEEDPEDYYPLGPKMCCSAVTRERVYIGSMLEARIDGRSSIGKLFLFVHVSAGKVDPGWDGQLTLELYNATDDIIPIYYGMALAQITFNWLDGPAGKLYGSKEARSKYQGSRMPEASKIWEDFR